MSGRATAWTLLLLLATTASSTAKEFAPVNAEELALEALTEFPGATAVVLFKRARLRFMDYPREISSSLDVAVRLKILTEAGSKYGEASIRHSDFYRLTKVAGRTVLPDGTVVPVPEEAIFEERGPRPIDRFVTRLVFPAVEVGAILDYTYTVRWESLFYLEPWVFHEEVPTRLSEIVYDKPANLSLRPWGVQRGAEPIQSEARKTPRGSEIRLWIEDLPGIPREPHRVPFADLASRSMFVPKTVQARGVLEPLMETWNWACNMHIERHREFKRDAGQARRKARELQVPGATAAATARALLAFVRDEVSTRPAMGVGLLEKATADRVLADMQGGPVAKALLLQVMLREVGVRSDLVWVYDRSRGWADLTVPNPWWFDAALVRIGLDGREVYLDPVDRGVGFGRLAPYYEGTRGVLVRGRSEVVELATSPHSEHLRRARIDLRLDESGRVTGTGSLERTGHRAWRFLRWKEDPAETTEAWRRRLEERHPGFAIGNVEVREEIEAQAVRVTWRLTREPPEVPADRITLDPSRPIGPAVQPFPQPVEVRRTPARMPYGYRDELTWTLSWPEGWTLESRPAGLDHQGSVGSLEWRINGDPIDRQLTVERRFDLARPEIGGPEEYHAARLLYAHAASADARSLILVRD